jgi:RHS repeat-associated protein
VLERYVYDGFDHVKEHRKTSGTGTSTTRYTDDPLDRTATKTTNAGVASEKTTTFNYLGLSKGVLEVAGKLTKSYQYSPWGERLSQVTHKADGTEEDAYYGYNPHTDVEQIIDETGNTKATYGDTAYGNNNDAEFTGIDKPDVADPTKEPYNAYRFNAKRWDQNSQSYDMGFRDYSPGLNRFLTRDSYNGALSDLNLGINPWTGNRYAFGAGNPITMIEVDGHVPDDDVLPISVLGAAATAAGAAALGTAALLALPVIAVAGVAMALNQDQSAEEAADAAGIHGTEEGGDALRKVADELQGTRDDWAVRNGTTQVVRVWDAETGEYIIKVGVEDAAIKSMPEGWEEIIRQTVGEDEKIEFVENLGHLENGVSAHAELSVLAKLGDNEVIVEGGTSRNICIAQCEAALKGAGGRSRWEKVPRLAR